MGGEGGGRKRIKDGIVLILILFLIGHHNEAGITMC